MKCEWCEQEACDCQRVIDAIDASWVAPPEMIARVDRLFKEKLAAEFPDHPWVRPKE
jgi:hypothetical protein